MAEPTETPWTMESVGRGAYGIWDAKRRRIAETVNSASTLPDSFTAAEIEARARLLTAAPELLSTLEVMIVAISTGPATPHLKDAVRDGLNAIAAAKGETS